jgi:two-component system response regulator YesN
MIKIILIEDEPSAMRYLKSIIELKCSGFEIIDTAENGVEGLEKIRRIKPDIVITDIKMAVMDGIELVSHIKEEFPFINSIIVSGYQDFEYAKGAIKSGVVEYLLKPVNPGQLKNLLDTIKEKLEREFYIKRVALLKNILSGAAVEAWYTEKYLPFKNYSIAILRKNGLPSRFSSQYGASYHSIALETDTLMGLKGYNNIWIITGRDEQELVIIYTAEISCDKSFEELVTMIEEKITLGYHTLVFSSKLFTLTNCMKVVSNLYRILDNNIVIGVTQRIYDTQEIRLTTENRILTESKLVNKISFLLSNAMYDEMKREFVSHFACWEKDKLTQLWVENNLRQILRYLEEHSLACTQEQNRDLEFMLEEAMYYSTTFSELLVNIWDIVERITKHVQRSPQKVDTPSFIKSIEVYIEQNLAEPISLQSVCLMFGISQTYLSRLFRKYKKMSFNEYITMTRIDKAKRMIEKNPNILLKEVAALVGYGDPFYFSRVFRSVTGIPPSEYIMDNSTLPSSEWIDV